MTDRIERVVTDCVRAWLGAGVPQGRVEDMRAELTSHLRDAEANGRAPSEVVGDDVGAFAREWAAEAVSGSREQAAHTSGAGTMPAARVRRDTLGAAILLVATAGIVSWLWTIEASGDMVWRWVWIAMALFLAVGEIFTAGFFLLPFAIGAGVAGVLAWVDGPVLAQWIAFLGTSLATLVYLQRFIRRQDERPSLPVGATRYVGAHGIVLSDIDPDQGTGMVRVETEQWRATSDEGPIPAGTAVRVTEIRGTRLVVER